MSRLSTLHLAAAVLALPFSLQLFEYVPVLTPYIVNSRSTIGSRRSYAQRAFLLVPQSRLTDHCARLRVYELHLLTKLLFCQLL